MLQHHVWFTERMASSLPDQRRCCSEQIPRVRANETGRLGMLCADASYTEHQSEVVVLGVVKELLQQPLAVAAPKPYLTGSRFAHQPRTG